MDVVSAVDWYACRPIIEDYHKGQKTGVGTELPQFESTARMQPMIGILSVVATVLLQLRRTARPAGRPVPPPRKWCRHYGSKSWRQRSATPRRNPPASQPIK